jgi:hypothetical protein
MNSNINLNDLNTIIFKALQILYQDALTFQGRYGEYRYGFLTSSVLPQGQPPPIGVVTDQLLIQYGHSNIQKDRAINILYKLELISRQGLTSSPLNNLALTLSLLDASETDKTPLLFEILGNGIDTGFCNRLLQVAQNQLIQNQLASTNIADSNYLQNYYNFHRVDKTKMGVIQHNRNNQIWQLDTIIFLTIGLSNCLTQSKIIQQI